MKERAREAAQMWEYAFGISFNTTLVKREEFLSKMDELRHPIVLMGWASWYNDPQYSLDVLKEGSLRITPTAWSNAELAGLLKEADTQPQKEARNRCLRRAEALVMNEMPIVPVYDYIIRYMKNECLDGVIVSMLGTIDFRWAKIKRKDVCQ